MEAAETIAKKILADLRSRGSCFIETGKGLVVHIEKPLPYICVYRYPESGPDNFTRILDRTESSYIMIAQNKSAELAEIIRVLSGYLSDKFGAFLIVEIWNSPVFDSQKPEITVIGPYSKMPAAIEALKEEMESISMPGNPIDVQLIENLEVAPPGMKPVASIEQLKKNESLLIGLEIQPFYINPDNGTPYPSFTRFVRTHLGRGLKKAFFEFVRVQTSYNATNFQMLGTSRITENVRNVDDQLAEISSQFKFLFLVSPINSAEAWEQFKESKFRRTPVFHYRLLPLDPELAKRRLYNIEIEKIEDPTLAYIFRDKRNELDKMISMLSQRDTPDFIQSSIQLFGSVSRELEEVANAILTIVKPRHEQEQKVEHINAEQFAKRAEEEFAFFRKSHPEIHLKTEVSNSVDSLMVGTDTLYISKDYTIPKNRVEGLIQHEVGTHMLTYINGKAQPLKQLSQGVPGYEELQEGLAVLAEYLTGEFTNDRMRVLAARVVAVKHLIDGYSFLETFNLLYEQHHFNASTAFGITTRVYRGGGLTKDAVYLRGLISLLNHIGKGQKIESLLIGKIREDYISIIEELIYRKVLNPMPLLPRYLVEGEGLKKLAEIKEGFDVFNLIQNRQL